MRTVGPETDRVRAEAEAQARAWAIAQGLDPARARVYFSAVSGAPADVEDVAGQGVMVRQQDDVDEDGDGL